MYKYRSQLLAIVLWIVIASSANAYMRFNDLTLLEFGTQISDLLKASWYGVLLYILLYTLRPVTLFPATPMTLLAGYLYGLVWGFIIAMSASLVSITLPYIVGRWFSDENRLRRTLHERNTRTTTVIRLMTDNPFQTVLATRFLYLPYDLVNFAAGSLHISVVPLVLATALGNATNGYAFIVVSIGASLEESMTVGEITLDPQLVLFTVVVWLISFSINRYWKMKNRENSLA